MTNTVKLPAVENTKEIAENPKKSKRNNNSNKMKRYKKNQLFLFATLITVLFSLSACSKDDKNKIDDVVWTEYNESGFSFLGASKESEVVGVKMHLMSNIPKQIYYKRGADPGVTIWVKSDGTPDMAEVNGVILVFRNIRNNLIDVGVVHDGGQTTVFKDLSINHGLTILSLKSIDEILSVGKKITNAGIILDGVLCVGSLVATKFTVGVALPLAKLTCSSLLASIAKKGVEKVVNHEVFSSSLTIYDTYGIYSSSFQLSPGNVVGLIGGWIIIAENNKNQNQTQISTINTMLGSSYVVLGPDGFTYRLTSGKYKETDNLNQKVRDEFGSSALVADWNDLKTHFSNNIVQFLNGIGILAGNHEGIMLKRNGQFIYSGNRQYFINRYDGNVPAGYLVHDHIANKTLLLGSWYNLNNKILVKYPTK